MAIVTVCTGFEHGSTAGWATGNAGNKLYDTITGTPTITTSTPRTGTRCLEISAAAATEAVQWNTSTIGASKSFGRAVFAFRFVTSLPAADVILAGFTAGANVEFRYHNSTGKLSVEFEGSAETDGLTPVADTWYVVEIYADMSGTAQTIDWWIDGVAQPQHTRTSTADSFTGFEMGCSFQAQTLTTRFDDVVVWTDTVAIPGPKGAHKVVLLSVDPAGTFTVSGSTANFNTFTANGTLAAWNATTARNNTDEIPPTIGASADGWVQITLAGSDYVEMPMTTYTLAGGETVSAMRMLVPGWATTTTGATIGFRSWNGTTETILFAVGDPNFDNSTTVPAWVCKMCTLANFDTQSEIDALAFRAGFSGDATPDIGIHAVYAELAVATPAASSALPLTVAKRQEVVDTRRKAIHIEATAEVVGTINLQPAVLDFVAVPLSPVPGMVTTTLTPAVLNFVAVPLSPVPGMITVNLTPAVLSFVAVPLTPVPGMVTVNLIPAVLNFVAVPLNPVPGMVTTNLTPATLNFVAVVLNPVGGGGTVALVPAVLSFVSVPLDPDPGMVTTNLTPATLNFVSVALDPDPGMVTTNLTPATLNFVSVPLSPVGGSQLIPAVMNFVAVPLNPVPGMVTMNLTPAVLNFQAVPFTLESGMVITMTVYGPPRKPAVPCSWEVDVSCCGTFWNTLTASEQQAAAEYGALTVWAATGRRFGLCEHTVRPCGKAGLVPNMSGYYWSEGTWQPYIFNGAWRNCGGCGAGVGCCTCEATCRVWIPGPVAAIPATGISLDGTIIPVDAWRVDDGEWLVRTDGNCWPDCQNFDVNSGAGFFSVTYSKGIPVPGVLLRAAGELACEWAKSCQGQDCKLPMRVQSISRQGVTVSAVDIDALLDKGLTGVQTVDQMIASFNPYGMKSRMRIASPDVDVVHETTIF